MALVKLITAAMLAPLCATLPITGFVAPTSFTFDSSHFYVAEQAGTIKSAPITGSTAAAVVLDLSVNVSVFE